VTLFTLHQGQDPAAAPTLIAHRFSWPAFLFGPVWLGARGLWLPAIALVCLDVCVLLGWRSGLIGGGPTVLIGIIGAFVAGMDASEMRRRREIRQGRAVAAVVSGADEVEALARLSAGGGVAYGAQR
jgi:glycine betaine/proline transport system permease protein